MIPMNIIGPRIKELRDAQGLTQEQLTARCNLIGWDISRGTLAKIEAQVRRVTDDEIPLLAQALKVSINQLYK
jgi:transcriptional regulator with XRE-family HTH domain